ncbi:hypothetical protein K7X08_028414 [Anisodus acutangulus]|uniref:ABC transporter domain-containing protein n=1 Tax=Anisodus acutangulus TaxID=402998 RepID=A0A9Q1M8D2_9SOLA|nr:hypothetical protein K7X08_028414 [Anisodus acutangulus]
MAEEEEKELKWAAIDRLPTYDRMRKGMMNNGRVVHHKVDMTNLGNQDRKVVLGMISLSPSKKRVVKILEDVSGIIRPSRMTLLLGPPGSGKTTLLKALAGKSEDDLRVRGKITYCGHEFHEFVPQRTSAYISQHDLHHGEMTVCETLDFAGRCLGVGTSYDLLVELSRREKEAGLMPDPQIDAFMKATAMEGQETSLITDYVLKIFGLDICADIMVGDDMRRGISGGQKKRVTTGEMLVGPAKAFFMDEISKGLDSSTTYQIVKFMRQMVHVKDITMVLSLLQPDPETFDLFDDVILLSEGQIVYQGLRENVLEFFEYMGFRCPEKKGIADFLVEVTSKKDQEQYWFRKNRVYVYLSVSEFAESFNSFQIGEQIIIQLTIPYDKFSVHRAALAKKKYGISNWELFKACFSREWLLMKRSSFVYIFKTAQITIMATIALTVFLRTQMKVGSVRDSAKFWGALFFKLAMTVFRLPVFFKQTDSLFYPAWVFALPIWVLKIPISLMESAIWIILTYYTIGFAPAANFFKRLLAFVGVHQMALSLFRFIAAAGRPQVVANTLGTFTLLMVFILGGFIVSKDDIQDCMIWGYYVSPMMYGQNAIAINEFLDERWSAPTNGSQPTVGKTLLHDRCLFTTETWYWICIGALFGFSLLFNVLFIAALTFLNPLENTKAVSVEDDDKSNNRPQEAAIRDIQMAPTCSQVNTCFVPFPNNDSRKWMVLPFQPLSVSFNHVNYYVDMPTEMKTRGIEEERLQLLRDVSGVFQPGILTALVGVSVAGKTTLMDVLAGIKTGGYVEGSIKISGYPKNQITFARVSGYCQQHDIHSPYVTVHESLLYSDWLRLPSDVNTETRKMFVEEVMELVELKPLRNALVGLLGVDDLSTEQRKRLTTAVELVANSSIVFMDEPAPGLDARAAAIVMRTVRKTVDTGRAVVCTIHQPSIDNFEAFDELLLMKREGQVIHAGPLGVRSQTMVEYFEVRVPKIRECDNPATCMLDVSSSSMEAKLDIDFAEVYANSDLYQFFMTVVIGILFGVIFWDKGNQIYRQQDLLNLLGATYAAVMFLGATNASAVQSVVAVERTVFYRERAAGMYSELPHAFSQVAIETIYVAVQTFSFIYSLLLFSMIGYQWTAEKFFYFYYFIFMCFTYFSMSGMMVVALTPGYQIAAIVMSFFLSFWNLFSSFLVPRPNFYS